MNFIYKTYHRLLNYKILNQFIRAGSILTIGSLTENAFRFIRNMILTRLLVPEAFGLMATVMASVAVMEAFTDVGLGQSIIQHKKGANERFLNIIWWMSFFRGAVLYIVGFLVAPLICSFYSKPEMLPLLRVSFLAILFNGLISPKLCVLVKELRFKGYVFLMQGSGIMGVIITMTVAFFSQNIWALVIGYAAEAFLKSALSFIFYPIKLSLHFDKLLLKDILTFSKKMFGLPILMLLYVQTDVFVVGKVLSMVELGMYALAKSLAEIPNTFLAKAVIPILLPTLAQIQDNKDKLKEDILLLTKWALAIGLPLISFFVIFASPILSVVYGLKYSAVTIPFGLLSIYNLLLICASFTMNVFIAIGQPDIQRLAAFIRTSLFIIIIYPATYFGGLFGTASAVLFSMFVLLVIQIFYLRRLLCITNTEYFGSWLEGIKLSMIIILPGLILNIFFKLKPLTGLIAGIVLCFMSWSFTIAQIVQSHKKRTLSRAATQNPPPVG